MGKMLEVEMGQNFNLTFRKPSARYDQPRNLQLISNRFRLLGIGTGRATLEDIIDPETTDLIEIPNRREKMSVSPLSSKLGILIVSLHLDPTFFNEDAIVCHGAIDRLRFYSLKRCNDDLLGETIDFDNFGQRKEVDTSLAMPSYSDFLNKITFNF